MISLDDILAMTEEEMKHWWNDDRIVEVSSLFSSPAEAFRFWWKFNQKFGNVFLKLED